MPAQIYDTIGDFYNDVPQIATGKLQLAAMQTLIGDVKGLTVLELACGPGFYCRQAIERGARRATGVDISPAMIEAARTCANGDRRMEFHIADCSKPFNFGQFDIVLAPWLLNYSRNEQELINMWRNIYNSLKPGGTVIGISPNLDLLRDLSVLPQGRHFGQELKVVGEIEHGGLEIHSTLYTSTPFSFTNYYLPRVLYEKTSLLAGLRDFQWTSYTDALLGDVDWDAFLRCPPFMTFTAVRPTDMLK
ncbi:S-adenosyl-L-methionine-dependent methyltransferase [Aspergillus bertholletiae]|uniref:S-adenosyl-L-methionine-dependent methyltransferase n=1 Tax=Aspergillus bertholletiae TaxID=1226010 RepID=A0A5N7BKG8_9EURO|nr:S-adenosyl-L-methionine-dependent methyltransferase [Aspergillus bertholletiae]